MKEQTKVVSEITSLTFWVFGFLGWNPIDENPSFRAKFYFSIAIAYAGLCFLQEATYFVQHIGGANSFLILTNVGPCTGFVALALVKVVIIYCNRRKLKRIVNRLESKCLESMLEVDVTGTIIASKKMMKVLTVFYFILIWIFNLIPLVVIIFNFFRDGSYHRNMPYFMWYPWECQQPIVFEICYAVVIWGAFTCAIGIISANLMFSMIVAFICLQFNILRRGIRIIVQEKFKAENFRQWIHDHNELMQIIDEVEDIFSPGILINFLGSVFILCMHGIETADLCKFWMFLVSSLLQIFIICWHGEALTISSLAINEEIYNSNWIIKEERLKKDLLFILLQSQKPKCLTAAKFSKVSLNSFMMLLGSSFTYFTFIRSVYSPKN